MDYLRLIFKFTLFATAIILTPSGQAGCTLNSAMVSHSVTIPAGTTISVPRNLATGPVGSVFTISDSPTANVTCSANSFAMLRFASTMTESIISDVYKTNVPGIGVKIWEESVWGNVVVGNNFRKWYNYIVTGSSRSVLLTGIKMQFYITGPVSTGTVTLSVPTVELWGNNIFSETGAAKYVELSIGGSVAVKAKACETPNITVNLEKHHTSEFSGINSASTAKSFNFEIKNCDPGLNSVHYTFKPATGINLENSGATNQYLTLTSDSTATGVGVQVLYDNGTIVPFNNKIKYTGYNTVAGGSYVIPMKARYIKTASTMTGGKANSALEFTMSYE